MASPTSLFPTYPSSSWGYCCCCRLPVFSLARPIYRDRCLWYIHLSFFVFLGGCLHWALSCGTFIYISIYYTYIYLSVCPSACLSIYQATVSLSPSLFLIVVNALLVVVVVVAVFGLLCGFPALYIFYQYPQSLGSVHLPKKEKQQQQQREENQQPTINTAKTTTTWLLTLLVARCSLSV